MTKAVPERKREIITERAPTAGLTPKPISARAGRPVMGSDGPATSWSRNRELVVILCALGSLIAEVELWSWVFAHMYGPCSRCGRDRGLAPHATWLRRTAAGPLTRRST
jgi:hypothetical protein